MIKILENKQGLQCGGHYHVKTDSGKAVLQHVKSKKTVRLTYELLRKIRHEYVQTDDYSM
ncbi:hypothetical protein CL622_03575 [archaeon]|nr:hypothetical protein [archaeon]|tara:strand:- start:370 stop:549 length:180 start_codon:yes stop_codon:yes gene_type:complete